MKVTGAVFLILALSASAKDFTPQNRDAIRSVPPLQNSLGFSQQDKLLLCQQAVKENPNSASAYLKLGEALSGPFDDSKAVEAFLHAIRLKPDYVEAYNALAWSYLDLDSPFGSLVLYKDDIDGAKNAIEACKRAISIKPDFVEPYLALGIAYNRLSRYVDAARTYQTAIALDPQYADSYGGLGYAYESLGRFDDAIEAYKNEIDMELDCIARGTETIKPAYMPRQIEGFFSNYITLARLYTEASRYEEAIETYNRAIEIQPEDAMAHHNQGLTYLASGDKESALNKYKLLVDMAQRAKDDFERDIYKRFAEDLCFRAQN